MSNGKLKRSAVLLFYHEPSVVQVGSHLQIGKFGSKSDLQYQDLLEESLICIADKVINIIYLKYLKAKITYENDRRVETYPYARSAVREAIFNAIAHNCYMYGTPIQIRIEDTAMIISNRCVLPDGWTVETFMEEHESIPYNPEIANVFYRAGFIEHWGRGIAKICDSCREIGAELPEYALKGTGLRVHFKALPEAIIDDAKALKDHNDTLGDTLNNTLESKIIRLLITDPGTTQSVLAEKINVSVPTVKRIMKNLISNGKIERKGGKRSGYWEVK